MKKLFLVLVLLISGVVAKSQSIAYTVAFSDPEDQLYVNNDTLTVNDQYASVKVWLEGSVLYWEYISTPPSGTLASGSRREFSLRLSDSYGPLPDVFIVDDQGSSATSSKSESGSLDLGPDNLTIDILVNQTFNRPSSGYYQSGYWAIADFAY